MSIVMLSFDILANSATVKMNFSYYECTM